MNRIFVIGLIYIATLILLTVLKSDGFGNPTWMSISNLSGCIAGSLSPEENVDVFAWHPISGIRDPLTCFAYPLSFSTGMCPTIVSDRMAAFGVLSVGDARGPIIENISPNVNRCLVRFGGPVLNVPVPLTTHHTYVIQTFTPMSLVTFDASAGWNASDHVLEYKATQVDGATSFDIVLMNMDAKGRIILQVGNDYRGVSNIMVLAKNYAGWSTSGVEWNVAINPPLTPATTSIFL